MINIFIRFMNDLKSVYSTSSLIERPESLGLLECFNPESIFI